MYTGGSAIITYNNGFLIGDKNGEVDNDICKVEGIVMNATGETCSYAEITIGFYDKDGVKVTSGIDNILNLKHNEKWRYTVHGFGSGITTYKIEEITWY